MSRYDDIINIPHWNPKSHPRMSEYDRAAQFAPFSALTGFDAMVNETARLTDAESDLDEEQILALNEAFSAILEHINEHPRVCIKWFRKDERKQGGEYVKTEGSVRNVELANRLLILKEGDRISLDDIVSIALLSVEVKIIHTRE